LKAVGTIASRAAVSR